MFIKIDTKLETPIYLQLINQIVENIANGSLKPGDELPSTRSLAADIGINMHTVNKAYNILKQKGLLIIYKRGGIVAIRDQNINKEENISLIENLLRPIIAEGICHGLTSLHLQSIVNEIYNDIKGRERKNE
jgi:DNA-binding transcriptional regulator YhcF (GntR family)